MPDSTRRGAVQGRAPGPSEDTKRGGVPQRPLTAAVTNTPTLDLVPSGQPGTWKTTTAPRSGAQLISFRDGR
jgi:hypothetical protein